MFTENYVNVPFEKPPNKNVNLRVTNIRVMLNTNILGMQAVPLHFNMLYHHDLEKGRYPTQQYAYPYYTDSVKYPMDILINKTYSERVDFFFNKKRFNTLCRNSGTDYIDYDAMEEDVKKVEPETTTKDESKPTKELAFRPEPLPEVPARSLGKISNTLPTGMPERKDSTALPIKTPEKPKRKAPLTPSAKREQEKTQEQQKQQQQAIDTEYETLKKLTEEAKKTKNEIESKIVTAEKNINALKKKRH
jgi:hypothetical protein